MAAASLGGTLADWAATALATSLAPDPSRRGPPGPRLPALLRTDLPRSPRFPSVPRPSPTVSGAVARPADTAPVPVARRSTPSHVPVGRSACVAPVHPSLHFPSRDPSPPSPHVPSTCRSARAERGAERGARGGGQRPEDAGGRRARGVVPHSCRRSRYDVTRTRPRTPHAAWPPCPCCPHASASLSLAEGGLIERAWPWARAVPRGGGGHHGWDSMQEGPRTRAAKGARSACACALIDLRHSQNASRALACIPPSHQPSIVGTRYVRHVRRARHRLQPSGTRPRLRHPGRRPRSRIVNQNLLEPSRTLSF